MVVQECDLTPDTFVIASNAFTQTRGSGGGNQGAMNSWSTLYGDVTFLQGGIPKVIFHSVTDPQGIAASAQGIIRSTVGAGLGAGGPGVQPPMGPTPSYPSVSAGYTAPGPFGQPVPQAAPGSPPPPHSNANPPAPPQPPALATKRPATENETNYSVR